MVNDAGQRRGMQTVAGRSSTEHASSEHAVGHDP